MPPTILEQAQAGTSQYVSLDRLEWLDQLDKAVEPSDRVGKRILADCKSGAANSQSDHIAVLRSDVLAICGMEPAV